MSEKSLKRSLSEILHWRHDSKLWHHNHFFPFPYRICSTKSDFDIVHDISYLLILILLNMTVELRRKFSRSFIFFKKNIFSVKLLKKLVLLDEKVLALQNLYGTLHECLYLSKLGMFFYFLAKFRRIRSQVFYKSTCS